MFIYLFNYVGDGCGQTSGEYFRDLTGRVQQENIVPTSIETRVPEYPEDLVTEIDAAHDNEVEVVD